MSDPESQCILDGMHRSFQVCREADWVLGNSFDDLKTKEVNLKPPVLHIGPLLPSSFLNSEHSKDMRVETSIWTECHCSEWLDAKPPDHVSESFQYPIDTHLPLQPLRNNMQLISRLGRGTFKPGYYRLCFDSYNILRFIYDDQSGLKDNYGPSGRQNTLYVQAMLNAYCNFMSNDGFNIAASDYGESPKRRLTLDIVGNLRIYSLVEEKGTWTIVWMVVRDQCRVHSFCGMYGLCIYTRKPSCACTQWWSPAEICSFCSHHEDLFDLC